MHLAVVPQTVAVSVQVSADISALKHGLNLKSHLSEHAMYTQQAQTLSSVRLQPRTTLVLGTVAADY